MALVSIAYDSATRRAVLSSESNLPAWNQIRRACEDNATSVEDLGPDRIALPWWSFLAARAAINYYLRKHNIDVSIGDEARVLLEQSRDRELSYEQAVEAHPISVDELRQTLVSKGFSRQLKDYQASNVARLVAMKNGATFSVPGAGKTTEALAYLWYLREPHWRLLVVCPKNAFAVWEEQIKLCVPTFDGSIIRLTGGTKNIATMLDNEPTVALVTFQQLPNVVEHVAAYVGRHTSCLFVDESHKIKRGAGGVWADAVLSIGPLASHRLVMTGTPMPQATADLLPQFNVLYPDIRADESSVGDLIKPVYVRTTKDQLDLPRLTRIATQVPLSNEQRYLYDLLRSEIAREIRKELGSSQKNQLRRVGRSAMRMIQFVANPMLLASSGALSEDLLGQLLSGGDSPKIELACKRARQLAAIGQKCIIWSTFVQNVELLAYRLGDLGADYIHGGVEAGSEEEEDTRERKLWTFHNKDSAYVLVANPAACGEGISLHTVCHHAIYLDRNFNAAQFLQSEDRIHRLGLPSNQPTIVELLVAPDTIDQVVDIRLRSKVARMGEVLNDRNLNIDPIDFDPESEVLEEDDVKLFLEHLAGREMDE